MTGVDDRPTGRTPTDEASRSRPHLHAVNAPEAEPPVDPAVVSSVRRAVAEQLAARLAAGPVADDSHRRELARGLIAGELAARRREQVRTGQVATSQAGEARTAGAVMAALFGLGRLQPLVDDPEVENIEVDGCRQVWVCYADGHEAPHPPIAESDEELIEILQMLAARAGGAERAFSPAHPALHLQLPDGSRLAAIAWVTRKPHIVIRRHRVRDVDLDDMVRLGTLDGVLAAFLRAAVRAGKNIVVTGLQNAGKTTLIRALSNEFSPMERFATIEKEAELHLDTLPGRHPRVVVMEAREGSAEIDQSGHRAGEITLGELVVDALRMNLRRIIVGEVRGGEVLPMLEAMLTGDGSLCTLHARSAQHAIDRIVTLCLSAGVSMSEAFAYRLLAGSVDYLVHIELVDDDDGKHRYVSQVVEINGLGEGSRPTTTTVFGPGSDGRAVPLHHPEGLADLVRAGFEPSLLTHADGTWMPWSRSGGRR